MYIELDEIIKDPSFIKQELSFDVEKFKLQIEKCRPKGTLKRLEKKLEDIYNSFKGSFHVRFAKA